MNYLEKESKYASSDYRGLNFSGNWSKHFINNYVDSLFTKGISLTQHEFADYKNEHLPKSLYKFFPPTIYSLINIQNQTLHLSSPRSFNDPFDSYVCIETDTFIKLYLLKSLKNQKLVTKEVLGNTISEQECWRIFYSWSKDGEIPFNSNHPKSSFNTTIFEICETKSETLKKLIDQICFEARMECLKKIDHIRNLQFKITCFSNFKDENELFKNTTMWSHYADNHRGFCVKYSTNFDSLVNKNVILCGLFPVKYKSGVPKITPKELMNLKFNNDNLKLSKAVLKTTMKTLTTKSNFWSYEKEWRLIISEQNSDIISDNTLQFHNIDTIYLGCRIEANLKKHLIHFAEKNKINVLQTKQSDEIFNLYAIPQSVKIIEDEEFYDRLNKIYQIDDIKERTEKSIELYKKFDTV